MNNPSPLMPQGSLLEQKNKGRAKVKIAVFFVLAIHAIGLLALLMQGCNREPKSTSTEPTNSVAAAPSFEPTNTLQPIDTSSIPAAIVSNTVPVPEIPATATDYTIVAGDSFSKIAAKFHVTVNALMAANPGLEPTKLQVGKKIKIPPPAPATNTTAVAAPANGDIIYSVKSGDNLIKIASEFHTTVKAIRAANNLKTDSIRVGQKLTIPKSSAPDTTPTNGTAK